ncbi:MAG: c-type cytochrome [Thiobacillus sp.]|nr:c-type cytochrome [Thiobacillus sp.]
MMKPVPFTASLFLLVILVACGKDAPPSGRQQTAMPAASAPYGLDVYTAQCANCHGALGQGDAENPALKGMTRAVMYQKLLDDRAGKGRGAHPAVMVKAVAGLSEAELAAASVYAGE